jgi:hypothetical protein
MSENIDWLKIQVDRLTRLGQADELSRQEREAVYAGRDALNTLVFHAESIQKATTPPPAPPLPSEEK